MSTDGISLIISRDDKPVRTEVTGYNDSKQSVTQSGNVKKSST